MADKEEGGSTAFTEGQDPAARFEEFLKAYVNRPQGLFVKIEGEEQPIRISGKLLGRIFVNSAWIGFCYEGKLVRTREFADREQFWNAIMGDGEDVPKARFYLPNGGRLGMTAAESAIAKKPFIPRSRREWNKLPVSTMLATQIATEE